MRESKFHGSREIKKAGMGLMGFLLGVSMDRINNKKVSSGLEQLLNSIIW